MNVPPAILKPLLFAIALAISPIAHSADTVKSDSIKNPWSFDLTTYAWLPSVDGDFSAGRFNKSSNPSFIKILDHQRNFPMAFNGHFDAYYERLGFYLDGTYFGLDFSPALEKGESKGLSMRLGIMDYGVSYRVFGASAAERVSNWSDKARSPMFDIYTGGRTIWLGNKAEFARVSASMDASVSAPVIGGRVTVDITPKWYVSADGSVGGFGVDNVSFTSSALGKIGYRTSLFGVPASVEAGYKALSVKVNKPILTADIMMHGPYLGLTGYW